MDFHWVDGSIAVSTRPMGGQLMPDELRAARGLGLDILVSCLQPPEERDLDLVDEKRLAEASGLYFLRFRMNDGGTPDDDDAFAAFVDELAAEHRAGRRIAVHCRAGVGRSPLVAAAVLVKLGATASEAWRRVGEARGYPVPDNDEQRQYLYRYEARIRRQAGDGRPGRPGRPESAERPGEA
jgi:protein-tyrosine phosphatase